MAPQTGGVVRFSRRCCREAALRSADERIDCLELGKAAEIAISGPQLAHAMLEADRRDAGIVNFGANRAAGKQCLLQMTPIVVRLGKHDN